MTSNAGSTQEPPMASTSCPIRCRGACRTSSTGSLRSSASAAFSARTMKARRCANISVWRVPRIRGYGAKAPERAPSLSGPLSQSIPIPYSMTKRTGQLRLGAFLYPAGHHIAAWRHPDAQADAGVNFRHYVRLAQAAEAAKFDLVFLADGVGTRGDNLDFLSRTAHSYIAQFEPITLLSALAAVTERIGLVGTASTSFNEPYHIARKFASLDPISRGPAGRNPLTSPNGHESKNFNPARHFHPPDPSQPPTRF